MSTEKAKVLFLDDDTFLVKIYNEKFVESGCEFQSAYSVDDALRLLRGGYKPDILIADLELPDQSGLALLQQIHDEHLAEGAHIIVLTNHSEEYVKQRALELGAHDYVVKAEMIPAEVVQMVLNEVGNK
jgi:two-component system repressor protein LuxO